MGTYAYLFTSDSETPNYTLEDDSICLQSKYTIPVFWLLLFNSKAFRYVMPIQRREPDPEDTTEEFFIMEHGKALELYGQRESKLFEVLPTEGRSLSTQFTDFPKSKPLKYIHLNVAELASMTNDRYLEQVKHTVDSLAHTPWGNPTGLLAKYRKSQIQDDWDSLFELANINLKKMDSLKYWDLAGVGEGEKTP